MRHEHTLVLGAAAALVLWIVLTFALALRTGWTHVALVAAVVLTVMAIVEHVDRQIAEHDDRP